MDRYRRLVESSKLDVDSDSNWLITLTDMLSLLLVFFIMFFSMAKFSKTHQTASQTASPASAAAPADQSMSIIGDKLNATLHELQMDDDVVVREVDKEIVITIMDKLTFRPGDAAILPDSEPVLDRIADIIKSHHQLAVEIDGHTDNIPINTSRYPSNWELSVARSATVLKYFMDRHSIPADRFSIKGNAEQKPVASNETSDERSLNRRVEITLRNLPH